jgi:2-polyprenyl-6-methoxyphenol hydroxylase-like FAD-dependent oxidoreductase
MTDRLVIIAGGGIGGLATALTLHQIGVRCVVFEAAHEIRPLGVGMNLQPNAVRELHDLGITTSDLDRVGVPAKEWVLVGLNGNDIYAEPRGRLAGYKWDQYAVHRGQFHMLLYALAVERIGIDAVQLGSRATGYRKNADGGVTVSLQRADGSSFEVDGALLVGADGIHSRVRSKMHPRQPPIHWSGTVMWRWTTRARPTRSDSSFIGLGTHRQRIVFYPISQADPRTGLALINWIAEITVDNSEGWKRSGWFREVSTRDFAGYFGDWVWDWLNVPAAIASADGAFENPMIDRDPADTWRDGPVILLGDAAHPMYPTGSNGGSQAIIDARVLGAAMVEHGATEAAFEAYDAKLCGPISQVVLRNRAAGPFGLLNIVDERCGGIFDDIDDVIAPAERAAFMANYKAAAGFALDHLNLAPPTIAPGARVHP